MQVWKKEDCQMNIVVLAGGLSTERDVSFATGQNVTEALRKNGHQVILLDVFMGYGDEEGEDFTDVFARSTFGVYPFFHKSCISAAMS